MSNQYYGHDFIITNMQYYRSVSDHYPVYVEVNMGKNGGTSPSGKQNIISPLSAQVLYWTVHELPCMHCRSR